MAQNYIIEGDVIPYTVPSSTTIESGQVVVMAVGGLHGVALSKGTEGQVISVKVKGVFAIPKLTTSGNAYAIGAKVYYDTSTKKATVDDTKEFIGFAAKAVAQAGTTVEVLLSF